MTPEFTLQFTYNDKKLDGDDFPSDSEIMISAFTSKPKYTRLIKN